MARKTVRGSLLALVLIGCGDDGDPADASGTDAGTDAPATVTMGSGPGTTTNSNSASTSASTTMEGPTSEASSGPSDESSSSSSDSGVEPPQPGVLAGDIAMDGVIVNQGVGIEIVSAMTLIEPDARIAPVIGGRGALVRASYTLTAEFSPRTIVGRLWLRDSASDNAVYTHERMVSAPPDMTQRGGTFEWEVDPADLGADTEFRVQFLEVFEEGEPAGDTSGSEFPAGAFAPMGAWGDRMVLDVMLVPFTCSGYSDLVLDEIDLADFEAFVFNTYPVQELNLTVHEPVASSNCSEFDAAESDLPALREADGADPWVYYGGLMPGDGGGYSISIEGGDQMDYRRTFANHAWRDYGLTFDLFAHELGHNHGRPHSFEDSAYPGNNGGNCGGRTTRGWGVRPSLMPSSGYSNDLDLGLAWFDPNETLLAPTDAACDGQPEGNRYNFNDMMSYVYPYWVSAHTYAAAAQRIRVLSAWDAASPPRSDAPTTLRLVLGPEGDIHRFENSGGRDVDEASVSAWARCGVQRLPVRVTTSAAETRDAHGRTQAHVYTSFELPLRDGIAASSCVLEQGDSEIPFVSGT